jgi:Family of unknown function (DUF5946)
MLVLPVDCPDMDALRNAYDELYVYTMSRPGLVRQHVVDAFAVQTASTGTKPVSVVFGLVGLYLRVENQFSGNQVQRAHMVLGHRKREWPRVHVPEDRDGMTVADVQAADPGPDHDKAIGDWCRSIWAAFTQNRASAIALLREYQVI